MSLANPTVWSGNLIFLGAGATAALQMPPTKDQGEILFALCEKDELLTPEDLTAKCFDENKGAVCDLLNLLQYPVDDEFQISLDQSEIAKRCFPEASDAERRNRILSLRRTYDWPVLKMVACSAKTFDKIPEEYTQSIFTMIDACLRENRGFSYQEHFLSPDRLIAARELYILLINTMFACAWQRLLKPENQYLLAPYIKFTNTLAELMRQEGYERKNEQFNKRDFYLFSYSYMTTNFDPIFLWLTWQAHRKLNRDEVRIGSPARKLQLFLDFPNTLAMREPSETKELNSDIWYPVTEATAQKLNDQNHLSDRTVRLGKYYAVHGCSVFRHCPVCGRLNLHGGDSWNLYSTTIFAPGPTKTLSWGVTPRTDKEREAFRCGEYDAEQCLFCGHITHANDNYMCMQTKLKAQNPSFLKEITDETIAAICGAKHIILLGYSLPPDDAIWSSVMAAMTRKTPSIHASVICGLTNEKGWLYGERLKKYVDEHENEKDLFRNGVKPIKNTVQIFGWDNVRAYLGGIPQVFGESTVNDIQKILNWENR